MHFQKGNKYAADIRPRQLFEKIQTPYLYEISTCKILKA